MTSPAHTRRRRPAAQGDGLRRRGFSIIELLVAVIIIGILVTIIVPRLSDRTEQARIARASQDLELIQNALERVVIDHAYFVRLYVLDDVPGGDGTPNQIPNAGDVVDGFADERGNLVYTNGTRIFIKTQIQGFTTANDRLLEVGPSNSLFDRLESDFGWNGPYLSFQTDSNGGGGNRTYIGSDPWGNDYLFFVPEGLVDDYYDVSTGNGGTGNIVQTKTISGQSYDCDVFDRFTLLSMGPNGLPGDGTPGAVFGQGDDIFRSF